MPKSNQTLALLLLTLLILLAFVSGIVLGQPDGPSKCVNRPE
ncbi:hypothetical protein ACP4OV_003170 [Aristida adscensionis]